MTLGNRDFRILDDVNSLDKTLVQQLKKWGMSAGFQHLVFRYDKSYSKGNIDQMCLDLFTDQHIRQRFKVQTVSGDWTTVDPPTSVRTSAVACSATRLDMFDKLAHASDPPILQGNSWMVQKSLDGAEVHGFVVHDNLREMLLCEDSANHHLMSEMEQQEFLWKLFRHLVFGGQLNQYEDDADQYRQAAKSLYRTLIRVRKESGGTTLSIKSIVASVDSADFAGDSSQGKGTKLFPVESINNFCYIILDPISKIGHLCYHSIGK